MCFGSRKTEPTVDSESEEDVSFCAHQSHRDGPGRESRTGHVHVRQTKQQFLDSARCVRYSANDSDEQCSPSNENCNQAQLAKTRQET